jgi:hypothetical protein
LNVPTIKPEPIRPRLAQPLKPASRCLGSTIGKAVLREQPTQKDVMPSIGIANGAKLLMGPLPCLTHECCRFDKEGKQIVKPIKPFNSTKKLQYPVKKYVVCKGQSHP